MFYNFNAHRAKKTQAQPSQALAEQIFQRLTARQRRWAEFMQDRAAKISRGWLKALTATVLIVCAAYSTYLICEGLLWLDQSKAPSGTGSLWPFDPKGTKRKMQSRFGFQLYLDSLQKAALKDSLNHFSQNP